MSTANDAPCTAWGLNFNACSTLDGLSAVSPIVQDQILVAAQNWMYVETGRRFTGACPGTVRPLPGNRSTCSTTASRFDRIDLYDHLAQRVENIRAVTVTIGSTAAVEGTDFDFIAGRYVVPLINGKLWPWPIQDANRPVGHADTWVIGFTSGKAPDALALTAGNALACDLMKSYLGLPCDVPKNALSVSRNGVTFNLAPGWKGLPEVAAALDAYPKRRRRRPRLYDPRNIASTNASRQ